MGLNCAECKRKNESTMCCCMHHALCRKSHGTLFLLRKRSPWETIIVNEDAYGSCRKRLLDIPSGAIVRESDEGKLLRRLRRLMIMTTSCCEASSVHDKRIHFHWVVARVSWAAKKMLKKRRIKKRANIRNIEQPHLCWLIKRRLKEDL